MQIKYRIYMAQAFHASGNNAWTSQIARHDRISMVQLLVYAIVSVTILISLANHR